MNKKIKYAFDVDGTYIAWLIFSRKLLLALLVIKFVYRVYYFYNYLLLKMYFDNQKIKKV